MSLWLIHKSMASEHVKVKVNVGKNSIVWSADYAARSVVTLK